MKVTQLTAKDYLLLLISFLMLAVFIQLYPKLFPDSALKLTVDKSQIMSRADSLILKLGHPTNDFIYEPTLHQNGDQLGYLQKEFGLAKANQIIKENKIPVYFWKVKLRKASDTQSLVKISDETEEEAKTAIENALSDSIKMSLATDGELIEFKIKPSAEWDVDSMGAREALDLARKTLIELKGANYQNYEFVKQALNDKNGAYDFQFVWENKQDVYGEKEQIKIEIKNAHLVGYSVEIEPVKDKKIGAKKTEVKSIVSVIAFIGIFILLVVLLIQKLRRDKIDLKSNLLISILVALSWIITLINNIQVGAENFWLVVILPIIITSPFIFMAILASSSVAESESRDVWDHKLLTYDQVKRRLIIFPHMSLSIFRGLALAFISAGLLALLMRLADLGFNFYMNVESNSLHNKISFFPLLYVFALAILNASFGEFVFRLFFVSFFRKKMNSNLIIVIICSLIWVISTGGYTNLKLSSIPLNGFINLILGALFIIFFLKYDFVTVFIGAFVFYSLRELFPLIYFDDSFLFWNSIGLWIILAVLIMMAIVGIRKRVDFRPVEKYIPDYIKRNEERERIRRELEIARNVQLSFLPRAYPKLAHIEVASICIPATEVGGDYYDFIKIDDNRLGVVIGDVSGKGISAAFHMTLTKGFLKSQAKSNLSPREIMIHLNELFYENVDRGTFISMIYGVFDLRKRTFTFTRAGHNPLIMKKSVSETAEIMLPKGLALGLEKGNMFSQIAEEYTMGIHPNDIFMFYTDGFSEAMNANKQEFGEERLKAIFEKVHSMSPENILNEIKNQVFEFVGNATQHDDMTMIIIKIN